jgi:hypothetical protein
MATAGSIVVDLLMRTGAFETDSKRAEKRLRQLEKEAIQVGKALGTAIAGGAIAVATGLTAMVKGAIDSADAMRDLSIRTGVSTETLSAFGYAASQTGTDVDVLAKGMKVLAKNVADSLNPTSEQSKVFKALGIEVTDASGKLRDIGDLIPEIADRFKAMEDGTTKAALAQALFGKAGVELTEFLNQGSVGLAEFTDKARDLGLVLDTETAKAADDFNDTLGDLKAVTQGYALALAKELLPDLQELAGSFRDTATEGNKVKEMAEGTAQFLRGLATVAHIVSSAFELVGTGIATVLAQGKAAALFLKGDFRNAISLYKTASQGFGAEVDEAFGGGKSAAPTAKPKVAFAGIDADPSGLFRMSEKELAFKNENADLEKRLAEALSNPTAPTGGKGKGSGKSDAQKAAEDLERSYQSLNERLAEQIALHGETGEAARVRYEIEHGELSALDATKAAALIKDAEHLDLLDEIAEHEQIAADAAKKHAEEQARLQEQREDVLQTIRDEIDMVGMSSEQQEIWNSLKWAGVDAESEWGKQITAATRELQAQREAMGDQIEIMDEIRGAGADLFVDIANGKNVIDSLGDAWDRVHQKILQMIAENLMDQLFGKQGDPASGSSGGWMSGLLGGLFGDGSAAAAGSSGEQAAFDSWFNSNNGGGSGSGGGFWSGLISSIFGSGGGRASGGDVFGNRAYLVGEQGPEMFVPRTAGTVIPNDQTMAMAGGRSGIVNQAFYTMGVETRRTQERKAQLAGREARRAMARTGR